MMRTILTNVSHISAYGEIALLFFVIFFCGACVWVFRRSGCSTYAHLAKLPLEREIPGRAGDHVARNGGGG